MLRTSVNSFYGKRNFNKNIWKGVVKVAVKSKNVGMEIYIDAKKQSPRGVL